MDQPNVNPNPNPAPNPLDSFYSPSTSPSTPPPSPPAQPDIPTSPPPSYSPPPPPPKDEVKAVTPKPEGSKAGVKVALIMAAIVLLAGSAYGVTQFTGLFSKAAGETCTPEGIQEANLTANSVEIIFQTDKTCQTEIAYGTSNQPEALLLQVPEAMASLNHKVKLSPLLPATAYYYQIKVDGKAVSTIRNFLTLRADGGSAVATAVPTAKPASPSGEYAFEDFQPLFGTEDETFDIDGNGIVNFADWAEYQKSK